MNVYQALAVATLTAHLRWIVWVIFGWVESRTGPSLRWFDILSLIYSLLIENLPSTLSANDGPSCVRMMASVVARQL